MTVNAYISSVYEILQNSYKGICEEQELEFPNLCKPIDCNYSECNLDVDLNPCNSQIEIEIL